LKDYNYLGNYYSKVNFMADPLLQMRNISKHYAGVTALDKVNFELENDEIHCLVGENGSGKSTLIKIISGTVNADQGSEVKIRGEFVHTHKAIDAIDKGIQIIYQDLSLFPNLTVAENIAIGEFVSEHRRMVNWKELKKIAEAAMARIDISLDLDAKVAEISIADQQLVAICRALTRDVRLIIMDEPTASLTRREVESLLSVVKDMKSKGIATLFVSHKLNEVFQIADRISVLRDGKMVGVFPSQEIDEVKLTHLMTGKKVEYLNFRKNHKGTQPILEVNGLNRESEYRDINFKLFPGEILGVTGLLGSGRTELALSLFGVTQPDQGQIVFEGMPVKIRNIQDAIKLGIAYVPEDRLVQGLVNEQPVSDNIIITIIDSLVNRFKLIDKQKRNTTIEKWINDLDIKVPSVDSPARTLSGGNQQRVVLAKWISTGPKVLILDGPTIGIDVAAKFSIHQIIRDLASKGIGIILISEEIPEVYNNSNRVLVMRKGCIVNEFDTEKVTMDEIQEFVNCTY
jgi:simple sugar transport system ATP-binding protein